MPDYEAPEGWVINSYQYELDGDLTIIITYKNHQTYTVWWDKYDSVTMSGFCLHGKYLPFEPTALIVAMHFCVHQKLTPQYGQRCEDGN